MDTDKKHKMKQYIWIHMGGDNIVNEDVEVYSIASTPPTISVNSYSNRNICRYRYTIFKFTREYIT